MLERLHFETRAEWLDWRRKGFGASDAAAACGISKWTSNVQLWEEKCGLVPPKDLSGNAAVAFGVEAEKHLRGLFILQNPDLVVEHHQYDILFQSDRPWMTCSLDGEITAPDGRKGILEVKTCSIRTKEGWSEWDQRIKDEYYAQICHAMMATGYDFAYVFAMLMGSQHGNSSLRTYVYEAHECVDDMAWMLEKETVMWNFVKSRTKPSLILPMV